VDVGLASDVRIASHVKLEASDVKLEASDVKLEASDVKLEASDVKLDHAHDIKTGQGNPDSSDVPADDTASFVGDIAARGAETHRRDGVGTGCCVAADKAPGCCVASDKAPGIQVVSPGDDQGRGEERDGGGPSSSQEGKQVWT